MANEYVKKINNSIIIKPVNNQILQEDLVSFSNLIIRPQLRSAILQSNVNTNTQSASFSSTRTVNFLKPRADKNFFTTDWTDDAPEENFGIDSIDLTFDANYIPRVNINFKDVKGKALFDNLDLTNSPFVNFLSLPYPLFELELKGYYGKATSMLLSLLKFNTKFNSTTGNFESVGNFVGLNFGFLSDIPVYFGLSAPYMVIDGDLNGQKVLQEIYNEQILNDVERRKFLIDGQRYYTFLDLIRISKNLNSLITSSINATTKDDIKQAIQTISELIQLNKEIALSDNIDNIITLIEERKLEGTDSDKQKFLNSLSGVEISLANRNTIVSKIDGLISDLEIEKDKLKDKVFEDINKQVEETFGLNFTIENVFRIIINSFEVFFRLLNKISNNSAQNLKIKNKTLDSRLDFIEFEKQFPWPKWVKKNGLGEVELQFPDFSQYPFEKKFVDAFIEASINTIKLIQPDSVDFNNTVETFNFNPTTQQFFEFTETDKSSFTSEKIANLIYSSLFGLDQTFKNVGQERFPSELSIIATYAGRLDAENIYNNITKDSELSRFRGSEFDNLTNFDNAYSRFTSNFNPIYNSVEKETFYIEPNQFRDFTITNIEDFNKLTETFTERVFPKVNKENVYTYSFDGKINKFINILLSGSTELYVVKDYQLKLNHLHSYINLYYNPDVPNGIKNTILEKIKITLFSLFFTKELEIYINTPPTLSGYLNINRRDAALLYANYAFYRECLDANIGSKISDREPLNIRNILLPIISKKELIFTGTTFAILNDNSINELSQILNNIRKKYTNQLSENEVFPTFEILQRIYSETLLPILETKGTTFEYILGLLFTKVNTYEELFNQINKDKDFPEFIYLQKYDITILKDINLFIRPPELIEIPKVLIFGSSNKAIYSEYKKSFDFYNLIDPTDLLIVDPISNKLTRDIISLDFLGVRTDERIERSNNIYGKILLPQAYKNYTPELNKEIDVYYITDPRNVFEFKNQTILTTYFDGLKSRINQLKTERPINNQQEIADLKLIIDSDDIKLSLYLMFKNIHDKWFYYKQGEEQFAFRFNPNSSQKSKTLFELFDFVDRGNRRIGNEAIIDITFFNSYLDNNTAIKNSLYNLISELLAGSKGNQWNFYVLPSYFTFGGQQNLTKEEIYETMFGQITTVDKNLSSAPKFLCQYIGGTSTSLDIESANFTDDAATEDFLNETDVQITVFEVDFGNENQGIFKSIQLDQAEYRETAESLVVLDRLAQTDGSANIQAQSGNLYNVYSNRSYTAKIEMAGNMMILPSMYFKLNNIPMYKGYYLITKVSHTITQGSFSTSIEGVRIPLYRLPIVKDIATFVKRQLLDTVLEVDDNSIPKRSSNNNTNSPVFSPAQSDKYGIAKQGGQIFSNKEFIGSMIVAEGGGLNDANNKAVLATIYNRAKEIAGRNATHEQILLKMANAIVQPSQFEPWNRYNKSIDTLIKAKPATQQVLTLLDQLALGPPSSGFFTTQNTLNYSIDFTVVPSNGNDATWEFSKNLLGKQTIDFKDAYYFLGIDSQSSAKRGLTDIFFNSFRVANFSTKNNPLAIASIRQGGTSGPLQVYFKKS